MEMDTKKRTLIQKVHVDVDKTTYGTSLIEFCVWSAHLSAAPCQLLIFLDTN